MCFIELLRFGYWIYHKIYIICDCINWLMGPPIYCSSNRADDFFRTLEVPEFHFPRFRKFPTLTVHNSPYGLSLDGICCAHPPLGDQLFPDPCGLKTCELPRFFPSIASSRFITTPKMPIIWGKIHHFQPQPCLNTLQFDLGAPTRPEFRGAKASWQGLSRSDRGLVFEKPNLPWVKKNTCTDSEVIEFGDVRQLKFGPIHK